MHVAQALPLSDGFTMLSSLIVISAVLDQFGAEGSHGRYLVGIALSGDDEQTANIEKPARISQRLPVVAGRASDDSSAFLLLRQSRDQINPAADLKRRRGSVILVLKVEAAAEQLRQCRPFVQRCGFQVTMHDWLGGQHVGVARWLH